MNNSLTNTHNDRQNEKRRDVYNKNTKEHLNWHECKFISEETYTGNGRINVQLGTLIFLREGMRDLCLKTTTTTGCVCSWSETRPFRKTGWTTMANCIHVNKNCWTESHSQDQEVTKTMNGEQLPHSRDSFS